MNINKVLVIGSGTMGCGIAAQVANAGIRVTMLDLPSKEGTRNQIVEKAKERILNSRPPLLLEKNKIGDVISMIDSSYEYFNTALTLGIDMTRPE